MNDEDKSLADLEKELASQDTPAAPDGTVSDQPEPAATVTPDGEPVEDSAALKAQLETERKERLKIEQERNLLRNKQKEAERKALESVDKTKLDEVTTAYETLLAEKEERERQESEEASRKAANDFRDNLIAQRSDKVRAAAKALIDKNDSNLAWSDARDEADAASQVNAQLDALEAVLGVEPPAAAPEDNPQVHANNPGNPPTDKPLERMTLEEMEAVLPHAPSR